MKRIYNVFVTGKYNYAFAEIPVFEVKQENNKVRTRILHCNLLLPIKSIPPVIPNEASYPVAVVQEVTEEGQVATSDEEDSVSIVSDESDIGQPVLWYSQWLTFLQPLRSLTQL